MSRAGYIWIVVDDLDGDPLAAFTVKYECADWISRHVDVADVGVCRFRDGHHHPKARPVWLNPATLEPKIDPGEAGPMDQEEES